MVCLDIFLGLGLGLTLHPNIFFLHLPEMLEERKALIYHFPQYPSVLSHALVHFSFFFLDNHSQNSCTQITRVCTHKF